MFGFCSYFVCLLKIRQRNPLELGAKRVKRPFPCWCVLEKSTDFLLRWPLIRTSVYFGVCNQGHRCRSIKPDDHASESELCVALAVAARKLRFRTRFPITNTNRPRKWIFFFFPFASARSVTSRCFFFVFVELSKIKTAPSSRRYRRPFFVIVFRRFFSDLRIVITDRTLQIGELKKQTLG